MEIQKKEFNCDVEERSINDTIYGSIKLYAPVCSIIDTPEFQRLRNIKQLGTVDLVYPCANHNRFCHSIGVYKLAIEVGKQLFLKFPDKLNKKDILCVSISALIHDLGHGPFSHMFDGPFMQRNNPTSNWKHEEGSKLMFRHLLKNNPDVRELLDQYLDEQDYVFVEELITPPKSFFDEKGNWMPKGRPIEKSFLYDLISNPNDGLDIDKMDYFLRDSKCSGVDITFSYDKAKRLFSHMKICHSNKYGFLRIAYSEKVRDDCASTFQARVQLHSIVYKHKTAIAAEEQFVEVLTLAEPYLKFAGSDGKLYTMSKSIEDMAAYSKVTDVVFDLIRASSDERLKPAQQVLIDIEYRRIYRCLGNFPFKFKSHADKACRQTEIFFAQNGLARNDYFIIQSAIHQGFGMNQDPMNRICFFSADGKADSPIFSPISSLQNISFVHVCVYLKSYEHRRDLRTNLHDFFTKNFYSQNGYNPQIDTNEMDGSNGSQSKTAVF